MSLGIPACEMLDLAAITETPQRSFLTPASHQAEDCSPLDPPVVEMSVKADIHCHTVNSPGTTLPDLLPR